MRHLQRSFTNPQSPVREQLHFGGTERRFDRVTLTVAMDSDSSRNWWRKAVVRLALRVTAVDSTGHTGTFDPSMPHGPANGRPRTVSFSVSGDEAALREAISLPCVVSVCYLEASVARYGSGTGPEKVRPSTREQYAKPAKQPKLVQSEYKFSDGEFRRIAGPKLGPVGNAVIS